MHELHIAELTIFFSLFLAGSVIVHFLTQKYSLPYTITIFAIGLIIQATKNLLPFPIAFNLSTDTIFFILLPFLLFESALHIKFHQFRLQFKTISFISTFGLLFSVFTIGFMLPLLIGIPLPVALLFGAIISATDPVAVLALFKTLPVPKRLALLVDGESMFNDGTGVIVFKLVSTFVLGGAAFSSEKLASSLGNFLYVFFGAMILGALLGYIVSLFIKKVKKDRIASTSLTVAAAIGSFVIAEHFFHISGVITTVITGIIIGNLSTVRMSFQVRHFIEEMWDYIAFLANTLVFFFIGYVFKIEEFLTNPIYYITAVIVVLIGRAATVYLSFLITNRLPGFKDEPNVPMRWQHLINWGGLRATIPILLVFTLPDTYQYKDALTNLTLATVLFTLLINGTTAPWVLRKLGLHIPAKDEEIIEKELAIFHTEEMKDRLHHLERHEFSKKVINEIAEKIQKDEDREKNELFQLAKSDSFKKSLKRHALAIERHRLEELFEQNHISESAYFTFDLELDLQEDALDFSEDNIHIRTVSETGKTNSSASYRKRLFAVRKFVSNFPILARFVNVSENEVVLNRYQLLKARLLTSDDVLQYFQKVKKIISDKDVAGQLNEVIDMHHKLVRKNRNELRKIETLHTKLVDNYQRRLIKQII